jgi:hypothetical protein
MFHQIHHERTPNYQRQRPHADHEDWVVHSCSAREARETSASRQRKRHERC